MGRMHSKQFLTRDLLKRYEVETLSYWTLPQHFDDEFTIHTFNIGQPQFGENILAYKAEESYTIYKVRNFITPRNVLQTYNHLSALVNLPKHNNLENLCALYIDQDRRLKRIDFDQFYMVTDRCGINTLRNEFERGTVFSIADVVSIVQQLLEACYIAHSYGFYHTAIKPSNISIHKLAGKYTIKLVNFGEEANVNGERYGQRYYRSPEQITACEPSPASDIWS